MTLQNYTVRHNKQNKITSEKLGELLSINIRDKGSYF